MSDLGDTELTPQEARQAAVAEYVLGLGSAQSRAAMARAIEADPALVNEVGFWENRFAAFNGVYEDAPAPASVWSGIEGRLFGAAPSPKKIWYDSLAMWRGLTAAAAAIAVIAIGLNILPPAIEEPRDTTELVAALQPSQSDVSFLARYDEAAGELRLSGSGTPAGAGNDYELWFIEGEDDPISMGVVAIDEPQVVLVDQELRGRLAQDITLAVTLETAGGSPTGAPQGPIVAAGPIAAI